MKPNSDWLRYHCEIHPDKIVVSSIRTRYTYSELNELVNSAAGLFIEHGIRINQLVPILSGHSIDFLISILGLWRIGSVPVPLSTRLNTYELDEVFSSIGSAVFIKDRSLDYRNANCKFIVQEYTTGTRSSIPSQWGVNPDNEALVLFTSGSSGKPKGVIHTFNSLYYSYLGINEFDNYNENDKLLASLPVYHIGGFSVITRSLLSGTQLIVPTGTDYESITDAMNIFDPTIMSLVPTNLQRIISNGIKPNKSLRSVYLGGGPSSVELVRDSIEQGYPVVKVYGSTETASMVTAVRITNSNEFGSSGKSLDDNKVVANMDNKIEVEGRVIGEIVIKSQSLFKSYLKDDDLTEVKLSDGYFYTGDYGYVDSNGLLYVLMRRSDLIVSGGENINPGEVRNELMKVNGIKDCYVTGVSDDEWGQAVTAFIVMEDPVTAADVTIVTELKKLLASYKIPKRFIRVKEIPRDSLGKIRREMLIEKFNHS